MRQRLERRRKLRDIVDSTVKDFEGQREREADGRELPGRVPADDQHQGPRGVRPVEGADGSCASATA